MAPDEIHRRAVIKAIGTASVAGGAFAGVATASGRERYDPLPDEPGMFLGPSSGRRPRYVGPPGNQREHLAAGCRDEEAPGWFERWFCGRREPRR